MPREKTAGAAWYRFERASDIKIGGRLVHFSEQEKTDRLPEKEVKWLVEVGSIVPTEAPEPEQTEAVSNGNRGM